MALPLAPRARDRRLTLVLLLSSMAWTGCRAADRENEPESHLESPTDAADSPQVKQAQAAASEPADLGTEQVVDAGCPHLRGGSCAHAAQDQREPASPGAQHSYGAPLGSGAPSQRVELADVLKTPARYHGQRVELTGFVERACSRRGCWMEVAPERGASGCRVTFKDYGFLVPTDSAGKRARLEGTVEVTQVQAQAVAHYESEGARFPGKQGDGAAQEVRIVATGVQLSES